LALTLLLLSFLKDSALRALSGASSRFRHFAPETRLRAPMLTSQHGPPVTKKRSIRPEGALRKPNNDCALLEISFVAPR
jgi:hypothetical protein